MKKYRLATLFHHLDLGIAGKDMFLVTKYLGDELDADSFYVYPKGKGNESFPPVYRNVHMVPIKSGSRYYSTLWSEKEMAWWLIRHARKIDILHLFWISPRNLILSRIYKTLNPKGIVYIKGDLSTLPLIHGGLKGQLKGLLYNCIDILSVETKDIYNSIKNGSCGPHLKDVAIWMPNGCDIELRQTLGIVRKNYENKENLIITVGRLGTAQKNNEMLLEAIHKCHLKGWKIALIGPIEDRFKTYIDNYFEKYPHLKSQIIFTGPIYEKEILWEWYNRAKIFCLTSVFECMAQVFSEALAFGNYIITTPVVGADEITDHERLGKYVGFNSPDELAQQLQDIIDDDSRLRTTIPEAFQLSDSRFNWASLIKTVADKIRILLNNRA